MKPRYFVSSITLVLAVVAVALGIFGLYAAESEVQSKPGEGVGQNQMSQRTPKEEKSSTFRYLVAKEPLAPGEVPSRDSFVEIVSENEISQAIKSSELPNDKPIARALASGGLVTSDLFESATALQRVITDGFRAMALPMDEVDSIGGLLQPGDFVDVFAAFSGGRDAEPSVVHLLESVKVLAVRGVVNPNTDTDENDRRRNTTLVLEVADADAPRLALAASEATLMYSATKPPVADDREDHSNTVALGTSPGNPLFLSELSPFQNKSATTRGQGRQNPGREVKVFEGSNARSVYVQ
ncbi:pilus assembly protein CpaB [Marinobacter pelagius]|uniref:Pilus assembly protein CpaB n=1 Tax=Marinobacter pelagius TaxID=379482 RepID=A0A366GDU4_9GAMM|nr:Flp pilus assembly protein CpaB [Marinobacter pelagius]RBP25058.1 pilus assembly protein CpaB [Marinobacter pelagius]